MTATRLDEDRENSQLRERNDWVDNGRCYGRSATLSPLVLVTPSLHPHPAQSQRDSAVSRRHAFCERDTRFGASHQPRELARVRGAARQAVNRLDDQPAQ